MNAPVNFDPATDAYALPLDAIDVSNPKLYQDDIWYPYFERLRREDPVHYTKDGMYGSYWSVTKYKDIMSVEVDHHTYSSEAMLGGISITDRPMEYRRASFISMDPPKHDEQRKVVSPIVAPMNLNKLSTTIRERAGDILDGLPRNETFDWVQHVSIELTIQMLTTLMDFPFADRHKLVYWSDCAIADVNAGTIVDSEAKRLEILKQIVPSSRRFAVLHDPASASARPELLTDAARVLSVELRTVDVRRPGDFAPAFASFSADGIDAVNILSSPLLFGFRAEICGLNMTHRLPAIGQAREMAEAGCLASYGVSFSEFYAMAANLTDKMLKGARPAETPAEQPTKFELVINLKTAKALGLAIPQSILGRADEVIE